MTFSILTLFPEIFEPVFSTSIIGRAVNNGYIDVSTVNIRNFAKNKHKTVDDKPFGGGVGMILKIDVLEKAISETKNKQKITKNKQRVILLDPTGKVFTQKKAKSLAKLNHLILVCGHYEGVDSRVENFVDEKISIGRYILTGGEIPAMVIVDSTARLLPGVLKSTKAVKDESYEKPGVVEAPQYTKPRIYKGYKVPDVLLSGNHQKIKEWKKRKSKERSNSSQRI